jgi:hypothetical protein
MLTAADKNNRHPVAVLGSQLSVHIAGASRNVQFGTDPAISLGADTELIRDNHGLKRREGAVAMEAGGPHPDGSEGHQITWI